ncbi:thioesterase family protein [Pseudonocardia acaciae]|uniref:thioesterase family protein n=1 Tax=Pseudonocardia acaciae TaxID=551276 RepID=UPI00048CBB4A|nr:thioesterase family protein [Pseudonocardia acaciae]
MQPSSPATAVTASDQPFSDGLALTALGAGRYGAELGEQWTVGYGRLHGGFLLALATSAGLTGLAEHSENAEHADQPDPVSVSAEFLRAPVVGPAEVTTEVLKTGRTVSVVRAVLHQSGRPVLNTTVTAGRLPDGPNDWTDLPALAAEPPPDAIATTEVPGTLPPLATACDVRLDPTTTHYLRKENGPPLIQGWVRPHREPTSTLFALVASDLLPPVLFNMARRGWAPTVQLTALVRARPAPGWLRLRTSCNVAGGGWLDEDYTVIDSAGRLVCQARQLALAPLPQD